MSDAKLKNLHKITTLKKSIFTIQQNDFCEICAIIKMINKYNRHLIERKIKILTLIFIDICEFFSFSRFDHEIF